jgi:hypothetical protein
MDVSTLVPGKASVAFADREQTHAACPVMLLK